MAQTKRKHIVAVIHVTLPFVGFNHEVLFGLATSVTVLDLRFRLNIENKPSAELILVLLYALCLRNFS